MFFKNRLDFVVEKKNNLVAGEYEVFGLVSYRNSNIEAASYVTIGKREEKRWRIVWT